jgi:hypothetical protein
LIRGTRNLVVTIPSSPPLSPPLTARPPRPPTPPTPAPAGRSRPPKFHKHSVTPTTIVKARSERAEIRKSGNPGNPGSGRYNSHSSAPHSPACPMSAATGGSTVNRIGEAAAPSASSDRSAARDARGSARRSVRPSGTTTRSVPGTQPRSFRTCAGIWNLHGEATCGKCPGHELPASRHGSSPDTTGRAGGRFSMHGLSSPKNRPPSPALDPIGRPVFTRAAHPPSLCSPLHPQQQPEPAPR